MIATEIKTSVNKDGKNVLNARFEKKQTILCTAGKEYSWGMGFNLVREYDEIFPEGKKMIRMNIRNTKRYSLKAGENWLVEAIGWRHAEGDVDEKGRLIVYVEGFLTKQATEAEVNEEKLLAELAEEERIERLLARKPREIKKGEAEIVRGTITADSVWKADRALKWEGGIGWVLDRTNESIFADVLAGKEKTLRLNVKNSEEHQPKVGERWTITEAEWHHKKDDTDAKGRLIVHVNGLLKEKVVETKTEAKKEVHHQQPITRPVYVVKDEPLEVFEKPIRKNYQGKKNLERNFEETKWATKFSNLDFKKKRQNLFVDDTGYEE